MPRLLAMHLQSSKSKKRKELQTPQQTTPTAGMPPTPVGPLSSPLPFVSHPSNPSLLPLPLPTCSSSGTPAPSAPYGGPDFDCDIIRRGTASSSPSPPSPGSRRLPFSLPLALAMELLPLPCPCPPLYAPPSATSSNSPSAEQCRPCCWCARRLRSCSSSSCSSSSPPLASTTHIPPKQCDCARVPSRYTPRGDPHSCGCPRPLPWL